MPDVDGAESAPGKSASEPVVHRSTYTPPPASDTIHSDDDLADALAAEFARLTSTQSITLPDLSALAPPPVVAPLPVAPAPPEPDRGAEVSPRTGAHSRSAPIDAPPPTVPPVVGPRPPLVEAAPPTRPRPWSSLPAPDPAQAVPSLEAPSLEAPSLEAPSLEAPSQEAPSFDPPSTPAERPVRRALPDDTLVHWADGTDGEPTSTLEIIERLESQLDLRQREAREYASWEARMLALGMSSAAPGTGSAEVVDDREPVLEWGPPALVEPPPPYAPNRGGGPSGSEPATDGTVTGVPAGHGEPLDEEEPPLHSDPEPATTEDAAPETLAPAVRPAAVGEPPEQAFSELLPVSASQPVLTDTGSVAVVEAYEVELDDDVDEFDRVLAGAGIRPPSGPISTVRVPDDEIVLYPDEPTRQPVFSLEGTGPEPTDEDHRVGRAARLFWLWFAANSSILSLALGAVIFTVGMSLRQSIVAVLAGTALSFIPLGLTTLAGKRSGQPTMIVSRATFGVVGNILPAVLALVTRIFWGAVLLWILASAASTILVGAAFDGGMGPRRILLISLAAAFLIAVLVAFVGYPLLARMQLVLSAVSALLVLGVIVLTAPFVDLGAALTFADGPWILTVTGAVLVFSFVGLVWANSGADLARYQRVGSNGATSMLWATFGATLPSFVLIAWGALLAASDRGVASGFSTAPLETLALMLPSWYPVPLLAATALSLLAGTTIALYSGGFALQAMGVRLKRPWTIVIVGTLLGAVALLLAFGVPGGMTDLFRDAATTLAVPTAAWAGIFASEMMVRARHFDSRSLLSRGGVYPDVRWVNLAALVLISVVGFGFTSAAVGWLSWQGYFFVASGVPLDGDLGGTDLGVLVALGLGLLVPLVAGDPASGARLRLTPCSRADWCARSRAIGPE